MKKKNTRSAGNREETPVHQKDSNKNNTTTAATAATITITIIKYNSSCNTNQDSSWTLQGSLYLLNRRRCTSHYQQLYCILIRVSIVIIKYHEYKQIEAKMVYLAYMFWSQPSLREATSETQSRNMEAGTKAKIMKEYCLLVCFSWLAQPALL